MEHYDVGVIGGGFGGLSCALALAEKGVKVALFERLTYAGGCASTFKRQGYRFESGATLFCGFAKGQLFEEWIRRFDLDVQFQCLDPVVAFRTAGFELDISPDREAFIDHFCALPGAPKAKLRDFFEWQQSVADALWECFADPSLLPPFGASNLARHLVRSPRYIQLARVMGRSLGEVLQRFDLWDFEPLRAYADAVCQITVQTAADQAEAPFALGAMDYFFRGTGHVHGGIGELAQALVDQIEKLGGTVHMAEPIWKLQRRDKHWTLTSRRHSYSADRVVANLLPKNLCDLLSDDYGKIPSLVELSERVESGWGAAMLYLGVDAEKIDEPNAHHLQLVNEMQSTFREGNHVFCSVSGADEAHRAPTGQRAVTVSTHVDMNRLWDFDPPGQAEYIEQVQRQMRQTIEARAPELYDAIVFEMTASPRTFERFTNRHRGYVGGVPRRKGLHNYRHLSPMEVVDDLYMVGDTIFPGQSTLAVSLGGIRVAEALC